MKFFYSVLFVPLLTAVGVSTASAQPTSLNSIYRSSKVQVKFSDSTSLETSLFAKILPDPRGTKFINDPKVSFKLPGIEGKKATVKSVREYSLDDRVYCKSPVEYFEIRRFPTFSSDRYTRAWRKLATASQPCPRVKTTIDFTNYLANMTGHEHDSSEPINADGASESLIDYENRGAVDVGFTSSTAWEAVLKYKNGKVIKLRFLAATV